MRKPEVRARILGEASGLFSHTVPGRSQIVGRMYPLGDPPNYSPSPESRIDRQAEALGITPEERAYDLLLERDGHALLYSPANNFHDGNLDVVHAMMSSEHTVIGLGDGGAHVASICDSSAPTHLLTYWTRDRDGKRIPLPAAVRMLTGEPAQLIGL